MANKQYEDMINGVIGQVDRVADKVIEIKTKYEPKSYDYSSVASTLSIVAADGGQQASITPPAGVDTVPIGTYTKIIITPPGTPQETPGDDDQVTLNGSFLWINKVNTDIMQWREIKDHVAKGEIMVIERIADSGGFKNYQLVKWEDAPKIEPHWETIDITTYNFTEPLKIRITYSDTININKSIAQIGISKNAPNITFMEDITLFDNDISNASISIFNWQSVNTDKTKASRVLKTPDAVFVTKDIYTIIKLEIWKDV